MSERMDAESPIIFSTGQARLLRRGDLPNCDPWHRVFRGRCKDHRFYEIIDDTIEGFEHFYLQLEDNTGVVRAIQPMFIVRQKLDEGTRGPLKSFTSSIRNRFPRFLTMRILMVGCVSGEGHLGVVSEDDVAWTVQALRDCLKPVARRLSASLIVMKDFPVEYRAALSDFSSSGYARVPSMPMTQLRLGHKNFDDYLATLSRVTRKGLRRKFRKTEEATKIELEVTEDISPYVNEVYPLYLQVHERSSMKFERLTKEYLANLGKRMPDRARFFIWRQQGKAVAFSVCMLCGDTLYDEYLGMDYSVALALHLYFYTVRDIITWALEQGIKSYVSSPLNYDPKLHLGCALRPLDLYVMHTAKLLNPPFRVALKLFEPTRHDPVLQRFPNAHEL